jgi:hypothetical protein
MKNDDINVIKQNHRRTRGLIILSYGAMFVFCMARGLTQYWHRNLDSQAIGCFAFATVSLVSILYLLLWFYSPWRETIAIHQAEQRIAAKQKDNEIKVIRLYLVAVACFPIVVLWILIVYWFS